VCKCAIQPSAGVDKFSKLKSLRYRSRVQKTVKDVRKIDAEETNRT